MEPINRIDVHTHFVPAFYRSYLANYGIDDAGGAPLAKWNVEDNLALMDRNYITKSILSLSMPGVQMGNDIKAREMARIVNEYAADLVAKHPDRFGFFATLTLPDVEGAISEMNYALDHLNADGIVLLSNEGKKYVGDSGNKPLLEALNNRKAVVFIHPNNLPGNLAMQGLPPYVADFSLSTVRAAISLIQSGTMRTYHDVKIILAHAGGFLPYAAGRIASIGSSPEGMARIMKDLTRFYFEIAVSSSPTVFPGLMAFTSSKHVLFGTDWPCVPKAYVNTLTNFFDVYDGISNEQKADINFGNAAALGLLETSWHISS